jgi:hypothetical protein
VSDGKLTSAPVTVNLTVTPVNSAPTGYRFQFTASEDTFDRRKFTGSDVETAAAGLTYQLGSVARTAPPPSTPTHLYLHSGTDYSGTDTFHLHIKGGERRHSDPVHRHHHRHSSQHAPVGTPTCPRP